MDIHDVCCLCNGNSENALHLFILCSFASKVWRVSIIGTFRGVASTFKEWWNQFLNLHNADHSAIAAMIIWSLWNAQNEVVWRNVRKSVRSIYNSAIDQLCQ